MNNKSNKSTKTTSNMNMKIKEQLQTKMNFQEEKNIRIQK